MLSYVDDIRSDLSVFHRIDNMEHMPAPRFFAYAKRLPAYQGALHARYLNETQDQDQQQAPPLPQPDWVEGPTLTPRQMGMEGTRSKRPPAQSMEARFGEGYGDALRNSNLTKRFDAQYPPVLEIVRD